MPTSETRFSELRLSVGIWVGVAAARTPPPYFETCWTRPTFAGDGSPESRSVFTSPDPSSSVLNAVRAALEQATGYSYLSGSTHHFYHYPARFAPPIAREVINGFSKKGDWVLDPFMGGGTTIIEGLALDRRLIGVDVNALAHFVTTVRTRPISIDDETAIRQWSHRVADRVTAPDTRWIPRVMVRNLPVPVELFMSGALALATAMRPRQRAFARCALLRLGQWALDCRDFDAPRRKRLARRLPALVEEMFEGLRQFSGTCRTEVARRGIVRNRVLLHRNAIGIEGEAIFSEHGVRPRLVFTSPPYPGVNVLYHRWQYKGRKETPAPYWIANVPDGFGQSFYTGGSRTPTGLRNYFEMITSAFRSVARVLDPEGYVVQLIGFSDATTQLPIYLACMRAAGLESCEMQGDSLVRRVPNRKWYAKLQGSVDASTEFLLIHRLSKPPARQN
jgi:hypothetical protein